MRTESISSAPIRSTWSKWIPLTSSLIILVISLQFPQTQGCMPGYEGERMKLRQYLGIEWVPNGLQKMDGQKSRIVHRPEELNCEFARPESCKWKNADASLGLDSLDFYLFRKEDNLEFPAVQVMPGPSKVVIGDQLLLTGDKKREEQSAMLVSWPIRCQNSTGRLTFTFWIYNGARVEVLLLEEEGQQQNNGHKPPAEKKDPSQLRVVPEKPHIDCGTVTVNTECVVEIPPRDTPFFLGIRAYDMRNQEGSFVMIDNIIYEAQFCKLAIDFGPGFKTEPLMTSEIEAPVQTAPQLSCHDFDYSCRWRNGGDYHGYANAAWQRGIAPPSELTLFKETGTYTLPLTAYAFIRLPQGGPPPSSPGIANGFPKSNSLHSDDADVEGATASGPTNTHRMLISDPIQCQAPGGGVLSFRPWLSRGVGMSVCALDIKLKELDCQNVSTARAPSSSYHHFDITKKEFLLAFRIDSVNSDFDNFAILDDIDYDATMCSEALNALDLGKEFHTTPMLSALLNQPVHMDKDLSCDFSRRAISCMWANAELSQEGGKSVNFEIGLGKIDTMKYQSLTHRRSLAPETELAVAKLPVRNLTAMLVSESIACLLGSSTLSLTYWLTGGASLSACLVKALNYEIIDCQHLGRMEGNRPSERVYVDIPPIDEEVRIALRADSRLGEGIVAVDDLSIKGRMCTPAIAYSGNSRPSSAHSAGGRRPNNRVHASKTAHFMPDENVCRLLSCNFNAGHMCLYVSERTASSINTFNLMHRSAHTILFERGRVAILTTPSFHLNAPARLHFNFAIKGAGVRLTICTDSVRRELDSCYPIITGPEAMKMRNSVVHDYVELLPTDRKLYFIAKLEHNRSQHRSKRTASVQIDDIELTDGDDHRIC